MPPPPPPPPSFLDLLVCFASLSLSHRHNTHQMHPPPPLFHSLFVRQTHKTCTDFILPSCLPFSLSHTHTHTEHTVAHTHSSVLVPACLCLAQRTHTQRYAEHTVTVWHAEHTHIDTQNPLHTHTHTHTSTLITLSNIHVTHYTYTSQYFLIVKTKISLWSCGTRHIQHTQNLSESCHSVVWQGLESNQGLFQPVVTQARTSKDFSTSKTVTTHFTVTRDQSEARSSLYTLCSCQQWWSWMTRCRTVPHTRRWWRRRRQNKKGLVDTEAPFSSLSEKSQATLHLHNL